MFEPLSTLVGAAVARAVLRAWLQDETLLLDVSSDLVTALETRIPTLLARRRTARQIDAVADRVAEKLEPFFDAEFSGGLPENERRAAADAVGDTLAAGINMRLLVESDLEPTTLERELRGLDPDRPGRALLAPAATRLYDIALQECCSYVVEIAAQLPEFQRRATQELLKRERAIIELVEEVLERLAAADARLIDSTDREAQWEVQYRRHVARRLGRLELFGLDLSPRSKRYALESAYVTLNVSASASDGDDEVGDGSPEPVDEALACRTRTLVRGEAGGGKTTLLQWLAVLSAERRFSGPLADWNSTVPFFIQLRRVAGELPRPEQFLDNLAPALSGAMPDHYVHEKLRRGEALVLVDGVDELPEERRGEARAWLEDLCTAYPDARYVITSRPPAADEDWLAEVDGEALLIERMKAVDIRLFVTQWHEAARQHELDAEEEPPLQALAARLLERIEAEPPLQELAGSPLLCAMLCALNRDRRADLPGERSELYRIALEMLLERRDLERRVAVEAPSLGLAHKRVLLQDLAYWLVLNGQVDVPRAAAVARLARTLPTLARVDASGEQILQHLLERTGLLQEPVPGTLVFVHRTFLEYLAALHVIDEDNLGFLVAHAEQDAWREIVLLTSGAGQAYQRERLITGLLERGDEEKDVRHLLHLLAAACVDLAPALPEALKRKVGTRLVTLIPPATLADANLLASAGAIAVPLLGYKKSRTARVNRACVRALGRIGGDAALAQLGPYAEDPRLGVQQELLRAWGGFDPERFVEGVLARMVRAPERLAITDPAVIPSLQYLPSLSSVSVRLRGARTDLTVLEEAPHLHELAIWGARMRDLAPLRMHRELGRLTMRSLPELRSLNGIAGLPLEELEIEHCLELNDISDLAGATELRRLTMILTRVPDFSALGCLPKLTDLELVSLHADSKLAGARFPSLVEIYVADSGITDFAWLGHSPELMHLGIHDSPVTVVPDLSILPRLQSISLGKLPLADFREWGRSPSAVSLTATGCDRLRSLEGIAVDAPLERVWMSGCRKLEQIEALARLRRLERLELAGCVSITSLRPLRDLPISHLDISRCSFSLADLHVLAEMPALRAVVATGLEAEVAAAGAGHLLMPF